MITQDLTLDWTTDFETVVTAPEPDLTFVNDPVAAAWATYRVYLSNPALRWTDINDVDVVEEDREQAQKIRSYYTGRILMDTIKSNTPMSEFRKKLYGLLIGETGLKKKDIGLLYRLPYFYVEDTALDQVIAQTQSATALPISELAGTFTVIQRILVSRRHGDYVHFWLQHNRRPEPFLIVVKTDNPLLSLIEGILQNPARLSAIAHFKQHRGYHCNRHFHQLSNVRLVS